MVVNGQLHAPAALHRSKELRCPLYRKLSGPQCRSGRGDEDKVEFGISNKNYTYLSWLSLPSSYCSKLGKDSFLLPPTTLP